MTDAKPDLLALAQSAKLTVKEFRAKIARQIVKGSPIVNEIADIIDALAEGVVS